MCLTSFVATRIGFSVIERILKGPARRRTIFVDRARNEFADPAAERRTLRTVLNSGSLHAKLRLVGGLRKVLRNGMGILSVEGDPEKGAASPTVLAWILTHMLPKRRIQPV
jgi:hypothetical protein